MNGVRSNLDLEFHLLRLLCEGDDYFRNESYEIYLDNDLININFSDPDDVYDTAFIYFDIVSVYESTISIQLMEKYITFRDIEKLHNDDLYLKLYGYNFSPYMKCLILLIASIGDQGQKYINELSDEIKLQILQFIKS